MSYSISLFIHIVFAMLFRDYVDTYVFLETAEDILIFGTPFYTDTGFHALFNYFPLAFFPILIGPFLYFFLNLNNLMLQRLFLKIPFILGDLVLAWLLYKYSGNNPHIEQLMLFNPLLIYISAIKGQFDVLVAICVVMHWRALTQGAYLKSGFWASIAFLLKIHGGFLPFFVFVFLLPHQPKQALRMAGAALVTLVAVLLPFALIDLDGMISHAILYHVSRPPNGFSLTGMLYGAFNFLFPGSVLVNVLIFVSTGVLLWTLVYTSIEVFRLGQRKTDPHQILPFVIRFFILFFLFNKVFWLQYAIVPLAIYFLQDRNWNERQLKQALYWSILFIPIAAIFRLIEMVPPDLRNFLGESWISILWVSFVMLHFIGLLAFLKAIEWTRRSKLLYAVFLLLLPIHYFLNLTLAPYR